MLRAVVAPVCCWSQLTLLVACTTDFTTAADAATGSDASSAADGQRDAGDGSMGGCRDDDPACIPADDSGCSDVCGSLPNGTGGDLVANGICEDGGEGSSSAGCVRGTDCSDCGARSCTPAGGSCQDNGDCCGYFADGAFCVALPAQGSACLRSCSGSRECPESFECLPIDDGQTFVCAPPA